MYQKYGVQVSLEKIHEKKKRQSVQSSTWIVNEWPCLKCWYKISVYINNHTLTVCIWYHNHTNAVCNKNICEQQKQNKTLLLGHLIFTAPLFSSASHFSELFWLWFAITFHRLAGRPGTLLQHQGHPYWHQDGDVSPGLCKLRWSLFPWPHWICLAPANSTTIAITTCIHGPLHIQWTVSSQHEVDKNWNLRTDRSIQWNSYRKVIFTQENCFWQHFTLHTKQANNWKWFALNSRAGNVYS